MKFTHRFSLFLAPTIWRAALSLLILPLTTYKLDPADFGIFALVTGISSYLTAVATGGTGYSINAHYRAASPEDRKSLISSLILWSLVISLTFSTAMVAGWPLLDRWLGEGMNVPLWAVWFGAAHVILGTPWVLAVAVTAAHGKAGGFARVTLAEATLGPLATLAALYLGDLGVMSLFVGNVVSTAVTTLGAYILLKSDLGVTVSRAWSADYFRFLAISLPAQLLERFRGAAERVLLARYTGMDALGIFVHSQQYGMLGRFGIKAFGNAIWSTSLAEAQEDRRFRKTGHGWIAVHFVTALAGILFAGFGQEVIALLTHGKFTSAYIFAALWMILIMLENTGKPMVAILHAEKRAVANQNLIFLSAGIGLAVLFVATPLWGVWGLVAAAFMQTLTYRFGLWVLARREGDAPFQDAVAIWGVVVVAVLLSLVAIYAWTLAERALLVLAAVAVLAVLSARSLREIVTSLRAVLVRDRKPS